MLRGTRKPCVEQGKKGDALSKKSAAISLITGWVSGGLEGISSLPPTIPVQSLVVCVLGSQVSICSYRP